jgi:HEAT repeat protein
VSRKPSAFVRSIVSRGRNQGDLTTSNMKMELKRKGGRALKQRILNILKLENPVSALEELDQISAIKVVNALFSLLYSHDPGIKWAAVSAMGAVVAKIADDEMEAARVVMRRLMWNLNDESGGIGWGSPEAMGEILTCSDPLAEEYANILLSYTREDGNYLEHEMLQRGLLWGIGRLAQVKPHLIRDSAQYLIPYLKVKDANVRGLAVWITCLIDMKEASPYLKKLREDSSEIQIYIDHKILKFRVNDLAEKALEKSVANPPRHQYYQ